jgi:hypothetical protein
MLFLWLKMKVIYFTNRKILNKKDKVKNLITITQQLEGTQYRFVIRDIIGIEPSIKIIVLNICLNYI